jgi:peroxiredoxin
LAVSPPQVALGAKAADFRLPAVDGRSLSLADVAGERGTVIAFICNHCPYVRAIIGRLVEDARILAREGIGVVAICSNDALAYPEDSFERMKIFAQNHAFPFPYLHDEAQRVARQYGAVCTPDFFGYDRDLRLKYRGRLDEGRTSPLVGEVRRDLLEAMRQVAATGEAPSEQPASIGCSIKWKALAG